MCYDYDFEMLKRFYAEELARRNRQRAEKPPIPQPPAHEAPAAGVKSNDEPVPA